MQDGFAISVEYGRHLAEQLRSMGVSSDTWLERNGLTQATLDDPEGLLSADRFRRLVLDAIEAAREPALGLFVGKRLVASSHGIVGAVAINAGTVRQALEMVERFSTLRTSLFTITHEVGPIDGRVIFTATQPLGDIERPMLEAVVLSIKNVLDDITMGACELHEVVFPFAEPEYAAVVRDLFGCPVRYGQGWAGFRGPAEILDLPLHRADPTTFEVATLICQRELDRLAESESFAARVHRLLLQPQHGFPSLQVTARLFHMTPRTLHRRLVDEGTSYRALLESVRHTLAVEHLKSGRFSMQEIAYRLGYTDLSNFRRAFKRWEKVPPSALRPPE